jgi:ATPase subunit of ABC transporter with duplicated ATPase domains
MGGQNRAGPHPGWRVVSGGGGVTCGPHSLSAAEPAGIPSRPELAALAGLGDTLLALERIEQGSCEASDYELLAERWDIRQQFQMQLERIGLPQLAPQTPASQLSGGQAMRVALLGAQLSQADFLILDEPSNHLDAASRSALAQQLQQWRSGLLLISHDRVLLEVMDSVAELTPSAITIYGGNYSFYREVQRQKSQNAQDELARLKLERSRAEQALRTQQERQSRRQARGEKLGKNGNQAKILLDASKERAQSSGGKLATQQAAAREALNQSVREAAQALQRQVDWQADSIHWHLPQGPRAAEIASWPSCVMCNCLMWQRTLL